MRAEGVAGLVEAGGLDRFLADLYGPRETEAQRRRYARLARRAAFSSGDLLLVSTPGRTELGGNHTDHNNGKVLAASVDLDSLAAVARSDDLVVELFSEGFQAPFRVDLRDTSPRSSERGTTEALIRGVAARLAALGFRIGGFRGGIASDVLRGSGLSSSASIEVLLGTCFSHLYNSGGLQAETIASAGKYAENVYFGKPSGLMDQMACATGGIVGIDFLLPEAPKVERIPFDFLSHGYALTVVDTGSSHDDLTEDYAAIPAEMRAVAGALGKSVCREISYPELLGALPRLRASAGERAILRAMHFLDENARVDREIEALKEGDIGGYLAAVRESGSSSWRLLQNCWSPRAASEPIPLALALSERFLSGDGACRVHGGGFAGTIQTYVPTGRSEEYRALMEGAFGAGSVTGLRVRNEGSIAVPLPDRV